MHHAYLAVGRLTDLLTVFPEEVRVTNSDVTHEMYDTFGIDEARKIKDFSMLRPVASKQRIFVLEIHSITHEAQNALLKFFEDPLGPVCFYLVVPNKDMLLPTLRSRLMDIKTESKKIEPRTFKTFLSLSYKDRLEEVLKRTKDKDNEWMETVLCGAEEWAERARRHKVLKDLLLIRTYEKNKSASKKMLFEHLALVLPVGE